MKVTTEKLEKEKEEKIRRETERQWKAEEGTNGAAESLR
jgi:hypothetical protein